jgi:hypothetical protein
MAGEGDQHLGIVTDHHPRTRNIKRLRMGNARERLGHMAVYLQKAKYHERLRRQR